MILAIDLDGTLVEQEGAYDDTETQLRLKPGARDALESLKRAGHTILVYSARANRALLGTPETDPLHRAGIIDRRQSIKSLAVNHRRYRQMLKFVDTELRGLVDAVDDGLQGKPNADLFIDDKAIRFGALGMDWAQIAEVYGDADE